MLQFGKTDGGRWKSRGVGAGVNIKQFQGCGSFRRSCLVWGDCYEPDREKPKDSQLVSVEAVKLPGHDAADLSACSGLRTQDSAQSSGLGLG